MVTDADIRKCRQIPIEDVVALTGLTVVRCGRNLTTKEHDSLILFHSQGRGSWYWFSQGCGGDTIDWIMHTQKLDFELACEWLLNRSVRSTYTLQTQHVAPQAPPPPLSQTLARRMHDAMKQRDAEWWMGRGVTVDAQEHFQLGVYMHHQYGLCYTIPVIEDGKLVNVRMRLANPTNPKDKYRPYDAGRGTHLFNGDALKPDVHGVVVTAGEIKSIVLWQYHIPAVSPTAGCGHWRPEWDQKLKHCQKVYVAYDPREEIAAAKLAEEIGPRALIVTLPDKPDDFILAQGEAAFRYHLKHALPLSEWRKQQTVAIPETVAEALYEGPQNIPNAPCAEVPWRRQLYG